MDIKCPICGKKYSYDRCICQECEDYSIYSGVTNFNSRNQHKWNCSVFLEISSTAFRSSNVNDLTKELSPEPNNLATYEREIYDWNCEPNHRIYRKKETIYTPLTLGVFSTIMKNKTESHLFFE